MFGIDDPSIWLAYLASILSALGCMVYGAYHWRGRNEGRTVKNNAQKLVNQE